MKFPNNTEMVIHNKLVYERNCSARYESKEEKQFSLGACAGMLLMWNPYTPNAKKIIENKKNNKPTENNLEGLPTEIGQLIGLYLTRKDAAKVASVCQNANNSAQNARKKYVEEHGDSYKQEAYASLIIF